MTGKELLAEAIAAAPQTPRGLQELRARVAVAETQLQAARAALREIQASETMLSDQKRAVERSLSDIARELKTLRRGAARVYIDSLAGHLDAFREAAEKRRTLHDRRAIAGETVEWLAAKLSEIAVRRIEAEIIRTEKESQWTRAAGHADLMDLYLTMLPVLRSDRGISFEMSAGSKISGYADALNQHTLTLAELREKLTQATAVAYRHQLQGEPNNEKD